MPTPRLYVTNINDDDILLSKSVAHHLKNVLRMKHGEQVIIFNGCGKKFSATIILSNNKVSIKKQNQLETTSKPKLNLHLLQTITRKERMDFCIQKAVECGATEITPIFSAQSEVKLTPQRLEKKMQSWQDIIIYAAEQCGQDWLPRLNAAQKLEQFVKSNEPGIVCLPDAKLKIAQLKTSDNYTILIGPEAGFSNIETHLLHQNNWQAVSLGPLILRTETAGIVALTQLQML